MVWSVSNHASNTGTPSISECADKAPPPLPSDGDIKLAWGEEQGGSIRHISEVERGLACNCACPGCGAQLVAYKKGKAPHFGHYRGKACRIAHETAIHKLAKQVLERDRRIMVPAVEARVGDLTETWYPKMMVELDEVWLEQPMEGMRPDLYGRKGDRHIAIEVAVTHKCGEEKLALIKERKLTTVEVYIGHVPRHAEEHVVGAEIVSLAPRAWLFNPRIEQIRALLEDRARVEEEIQLQEPASFC